MVCESLDTLPLSVLLPTHVIALEPLELRGSYIIL